VTATLGNVSESLDFIPGTYLLPHFTKVLGKQLGKEFFQAVAYGDFQVSPATIEINGERGLPVPKALAKAKVKNDRGEQPIYNRLFRPIEGELQPKPVRSGFIKSLETHNIVINDESFKTLLMHNTVEDKYQRPTTDVGGVFSREAIAAGTVLRSEIRTKNQKLFDRLSSELNEEKDIRLGTSRKDDYGLAKLGIFNTAQDKGKGEPASQPSDLVLTEELTVYLESDVLLRNANLRQTNLAGDLAEAICQELNEGISDEAKTIKLEKKDSFIQPRRIESWHEGWGFPRPTLIAMAAGSCVVFVIENFDSLDKDKLEKALQILEAKGIGERRGEGYGQIRFNPALLTQAIGGWEKADKPGNDQGDNTSPEALEESDFNKQIEETVWREELKVAVLKIASSKGERKKIFGFDSTKKEPPMSQIGGLRSVISRVRKFNDTGLVESWLEHLKETNNRRDKWSKDKTTAENILDEIKSLVVEKDKIWEVLREAKTNEEPIWQSPKTLTDRDLEKEEKLWTEAVRALFDACARAHKRDLEDQEKKQNG
jgi:CRISPR-associated protein Csx10